MRTLQLIIYTYVYGHLVDCVSSCELPGFHKAASDLKCTNVTSFVNSTRCIGDDVTRCIGDDVTLSDCVGVAFVNQEDGTRELQLCWISYVLRTLITVETDSLEHEAYELFHAYQQPGK